jgi:Family of unknown function (DUF6228)
VWESGAVNAADVRVPRERAGTFVRLYGRRRPHDDALVSFSVQVEAPGLRAEAGIETLQGDGLVEFVRGLDESYLGWPGTRTWSSFRRDLRLEAVHTGGAVVLAWTLVFPEPSEGPAAIWEATVRVQISPGEDLKQLSSDVAAFLS